ncbi:hypothetical protein Taro_035374 [Colocasia esculenta]|uniref:DDB1-and CUL4-associated factor 8 n=1 Tax=Colocasia esculenta TaxID=4460 RepID=A0A843W3M5_COLES|nr:hypothetical protein [Colocasia esculenta]
MLDARAAGWRVPHWALFGARQHPGAQCGARQPGRSALFSLLYMESFKRRQLGSGFREIARRELGLPQPVVFTRRVGGSEMLVSGSSDGFYWVWGSLVDGCGGISLICGFGSEACCCAGDSFGGKQSDWLAVLADTYPNVFVSTWSVRSTDFSVSGLERCKLFDELNRSIFLAQVLVKRLSLYGKLLGHGGCVNTVHFNPSGDLLLSGSDDEQIIFWNWAAKSKKFAYHSGHSENVFQARVMPFSDDRTVITSAADGQVRLGQIAENGDVNTKRLGKHRGRVHKLAIEPGSPHVFYSCGEDGFVQHFDLRSSTATKLFLCSSFTESREPVRLNAISINPRNPHYFVIGGFDEYARVYDIRKFQWDSSTNADCPVNTFCPRHLIRSGDMHITGLAYSNTSEVLVSYNDELIYLFQKDMGLGPDPSSSTDNSQELESPQVYSGHRNSRTVKGVSFFGPNDEYVVSGSDCGHVFIWRKKDGELLRLMVGDKSIVNCIEPHPHFPFMATSGIEKNVKLWMPIARKPAALPSNLEEIMESNKRGREDRAPIALSPDVIMHVLNLQRRQALAYIERRQPGADADSDDNDDDDDGGEGEAFVLRFTDSDDTSEVGFSRECTIC